MKPTGPAKQWWTADELAQSGLPDLPGSRRGINLMAETQNWRTVGGVVRRRAGRGGGLEYHWSVLPLAAQTALLKAPKTATPDRPDRGSAWAYFDQQTDAAKAEARRRLEAIQMAESLYAGGSQRVVAVEIAAQHVGKSTRAVYGWMSQIEGVAVEDRLAYLVGQHKAVKATARKPAQALAFIEYLKSLFMRREGPTFRESYRIAVRHAKSEGWDVLTERTAERHINAEVPRVVMVYSREGEAGLSRCFPAQIRDRTGLAAMEGVNADCHKIDTFVQWPDGTIDRPQIVGFQDLYSNKFLSWRVDHAPNKVAVMAAFGEMIETFGIPQRCLFDNGREFANKWLTGGAPTRFRFKIKEDDPLGVLPLLGIKIHWATPHHGQAKPIERGFRDFAANIAKDPRFAGAYVGNRPDAKPENYGSRAIPLETFLKVVAERIAEHNARDGRLSQTAEGRSFDETFNQSYANAPIRKATEEQRRLWIMGQHVCHLNRSSGQVRLYGNWYHSDWMSEHPGRRIVARFDPEDLHSGVFIYDADGSYLGFAECRQKVGFFDVTGARQQAARNARIKKATKALEKAHTPIPMDQIAADMDRHSTQPAAAPIGKVVSPVFGKRLSEVKFPVRQMTVREDPAVEGEREAMILQMSQKPAAKPAASTTEGDRFRRAQDILARSESGGPVGKEEARWVRDYVETAEYQGLLVMFQSHGANGIG